MCNDPSNEQYTRSNLSVPFQFPKNWLRPLRTQTAWANKHAHTVFFRLGVRPSRGQLYIVFQNYIRHTLPIKLRASGIARAVYKTIRTNKSRHWMAAVVDVWANRRHASGVPFGTSRAKWAIRFALSSINSHTRPKTHTHPHKTETKRIKSTAANPWIRWNKSPQFFVKHDKFNNPHKIVCLVERFGGTRSQIAVLYPNSILLECSAYKNPFFSFPCRTVQK